MLWQVSLKRPRETTESGLKKDRPQKRIGQPYYQSDGGKSRFHNHCNRIWALAISIGIVVR